MSDDTARDEGKGGTKEDWFRGAMIATPLAIALGVSLHNMLLGAMIGITFAIAFASAFRKRRDG